MKSRFMAMLLACLGAVAALAEMPRSEWMAKVGECAQSPALLKQTISQLSKKDQCEFLGEINAAIAKLPGSQETRAAAFLAANRAALVGCDRSNLAAMLAEVFATVPPEFLTVINENFAETLFNRNGNGSKSYTDEEYVAIAEKSLKVIFERTSGVENAAVRNTFAILMFVRASGGTPSDLSDRLIALMPSDGDDAKQWLAAALGRGDAAPSYDLMLGVAQADDEPNHSVVVQLSGIQTMDALLGDLQSLTSSSDVRVKAEALGGGIYGASTIVGVPQNFADLGVLRIPRTELLGERGSKYYSIKRGEHAYDKDQEESSGGTVAPEPEPGPYAHQDILYYG